MLSSRVARTPSAPPRRRTRPLRSLFWVVLAILGVLGVVHPLWSAYQDVRALKADALLSRQAKAVHNGDALLDVLVKARGPLASLTAMARDYGFLGSLPGLGPIYQDLQHLVVGADAAVQAGIVLTPSLRPLLPAVGYSAGADKAYTHRGGLAALQALVSEAPALHAQLGQALPDLKRMQLAWSAVNPAALPAPIRALPVPWAALPQTGTAVYQSAMRFSAWLPLLPGLLGQPTPQRYWLLFQNSGEMRATGGFITAYGYAVVHDAKPRSMTAYNIYTLDPHNSDPARYQPPEPLMLNRYLHLPVWHLRDANTSPNVPTSIRRLYRFYDSFPGLPQVNGTVLIDTWFVDMLLQDIGGLKLPPQYGSITLTASNANYEMEYIAEKSGLSQANRKAFIGIVMRDLWQQVVHAHGHELLTVLATIQQALRDQYLVLYFNRPQAEALAVKNHWAGTMTVHPQGDYLMVVDENLGGHKDNFFIREQVTSAITERHGRFFQTTTVHWTEPAVLNQWMVVRYAAWIRLYVPLGSRLISLKGGDSPYPPTYVDRSLNKLVISTHIAMPARKSLLVPPSHHVLTATYELPAGINMSTYQIQKQPGVPPVQETVTDKGHTVHGILNSDWILPLP